MYDTVIWATDGSELATAALDEVRRLEPRRIIAAHIDQHFTGRAGAYPVLADEADVEQRIGQQVQELRDVGIRVELELRLTHDAPAEALAALAEEVDADLIVCGTRGLGTMKGAVLGSVAQRLAHVAPCPVLVVSEHAMTRRAATVAA